MKYQYHIVTPIGRFGNIVPFTRFMKGLGVHWHLLLDDDLPFRIEDSEWIHPMYGPGNPNDGTPIGNYKHEQFIMAGGLVNADRYQFLNDDDWLEPGFLEKVDQVDGDILIVSMKRGDNQPSAGVPYGTSTLVACEENMKPCHIGGEQLIASGAMMKKVRFGKSNSGDGEGICKLCQDNPYVFVPDAFVWFNALEPGRWNNPPA